MGCNFGEMGTLLVAIFFFVMRRGGTTDNEVTFSQRSDNHSVMRQAVNLDIESAPRTMGPHSAII